MAEDSLAVPFLLCFSIDQIFFPNWNFGFFFILTWGILKGERLTLWLPKGLQTTLKDKLLKTGSTQRIDRSWNKYLNFNSYRAHPKARKEALNKRWQKKISKLSPSKYWKTKVYRRGFDWMKHGRILSTGLKWTTYSGECHWGGSFDGWRLIFYKFYFWRLTVSDFRTFDGWRSFKSGHLVQKLM